MGRGDLTDVHGGTPGAAPARRDAPQVRGRPNAPHRSTINAILWILRTGAPWHDLPAVYGPVGTVSSRFYRWRASGLWGRILAALQAEAEAAGEIDWDLHYVDARVVRAHQHAAGARRDGAVGSEVQAREALGRSQGGFSTKLPLRAEGNGRPITAVLICGERNEHTALKPLLAGARSAVRGGAGLACGRGARPAARATAARPSCATWGTSTSGR